MSEEEEPQTNITYISESINSSESVNSESVDESDDDVEMESGAVDEWIVEDGWFVTAPRSRTGTLHSASLGEDADMTQTSSPSTPVAAFIEEDVNMTEMSSPSTPAPRAEAELPRTTDNRSDMTETSLPSTPVPRAEAEQSRLPRTTRFAEIQNRSDNQLLRNITGFIEGQLNAGTPLPDSNHAADQSSRVSDNANLPTNPPAGDPENPRNSAFTIQHHDFLRIIHTMESLSANVQSLIGQGANPRRTAHRPGIRRPFAGDGHWDFSEETSELEDAAVILHKKKSTEENRMHEILRNLLVDHGLRISKRRNCFTLRESVPKSEVEEYEAGRGDGPALDDLRLDWTESTTSHWNLSAIYILATHVLDRIKSNHYPGFKHEDWMSAHRIFEELREKLTASRNDYENGVSSNAPETDIGAVEKKARYLAKKSLKQIKNGRNMRRKTLYDCRLRIINENLGSHPAWDNALRLMHVIGDAAMSDNETDTERSTRRKKVVRRVEKKWASTPLKNMLSTLDMYYSRFYWDGLQKPGPGPRDRITTIVSESPRSTPRNLPVNCYNDLYLNSLTPYKRSVLKCKREVIIPAIPLPPP